MIKRKKYLKDYKYGVSPENKAAYEAAKRIIEAEEENSLYFFCGPEGCGKTLLLEAIASEDTERSVKLIGFEDIEEILFSHKGVSDKKIVKKYARVDLLLVDDWDVLFELNREAALNFLKVVVNSRVGKTTVLACRYEGDAFKGANNYVAIPMKPADLLAREEIAENLIEAEYGLKIDSATKTALAESVETVAELEDKISAWRDNDDRKYGALTKLFKGNAFVDKTFRKVNDIIAIAIFASGFIFLKLSSQMLLALWIFAAIFFLTESVAYFFQSYAKRNLTSIMINLGVALTVNLLLSTFHSYLFSGGL